MPYQTGNADNYLDLLDKLRQFVCGFASAAAPVYTGTGNGTLDGFTTSPGAPSETWTIKCTVTAPDGGTFSVVGSVSGAQADATVGTPYDNGIISFTITDGSIDFVIDDQWTVDTTQGDLAAAGEEWTQERWVPGDELILRGQGSGGLDNIYVGIKTYENVGADYYNWRLAGFTGFNDAFDFDNQPGITTGDLPRIHLWNDPIPYWMVANGRRFILVARISTVYSALYMGFLKPYASAGQYAYPLAVGGSSTAYSGERWSTESGDHSHFADPGGFSIDEGTLRVWGPGGGWVSIRNRQVDDTYFYLADHSVWPYFGVNQLNPIFRIDKVRDGLDGTYPMLPLIVHEDTPTVQILGELEGCFWCSGHGNAAEDIITDGGAVQHLVVQNVHRTGINDYWALRLE